MIFLIIISSFGYIVSCSHDDSFPPPPASTGVVITRGTNIHLPGNMTTGVNTEWKMENG